MPVDKKTAAAKKKVAARLSAAERRRRAEQSEAAQPQAPPPEIPLTDGVVVWRVENPDAPGSYRFVIQCVGDVRVTEIGDTLRYALKAHSSQVDRG